MIAKFAAVTIQHCDTLFDILVKQLDSFSSSHHCLYTNNLAFVQWVLNWINTCYLYSKSKSRFDNFSSSGLSFFMVLFLLVWTCRGPIPSRWVHSQIWVDHLNHKSDHVADEIRLSWTSLSWLGVLWRNGFVPGTLQPYFVRQNPQFPPPPNKALEALVLKTLHVIGLDTKTEHTKNVIIY